MELADLLPNYPSAMTPNFQTYISSKQEFRELASEIGEKLPKGKGQYYKHQKFTHRFLKYYDNLLILSETGTGKSCEVLGFTELQKYKKVVILVMGETQTGEIKKQLVCKCSIHDYEKNIKMDAIQQKTLINKEIKEQGYEIDHYTSFVNKLIKKYPDNALGDKELIRDYMGTIFWIDEAHNLTINENNKKEYQKQINYNFFWRLFHVVPRCKHILSTATPMINNTKELTSLLNLILPKNGDIPSDYDFRNAPVTDIKTFFPDAPENIRELSKKEADKYFIGQIPENFNYDKVTLNKLEPYLRGKINYIRSTNTGAVPNNVGNIYYLNKGLIKSEMILYTDVMSSFQEKYYNNSIKSSNDYAVKSFYISEKQASTFIFPDGYWANESEKDNDIIIENEEGNYEVVEGDNNKGLQKYITTEKGKYVATKEFKTYLSNFDNIKRSSAKFASIIELINKCNGNCFVYGNYVKGGVNIFGICLEAQGYERFNETGKLFQNNYGQSESSCVNSSISRKFKKSFHKKLRFAIFSNDDKDKNNILNIMNSYENRNGEYIKVFITSPLGKDTISVNNVLQIHLIDPDWNESGMYQAISRSIRAESHDDLLNDERKRLEELGEDPSTAKININIYRHAAIKKSEIGVNEINSKSSIDLYIYKTAKEKDEKIRRIMRMLKQSSISCQIHYQRNHRHTDRDGSAECDYDLCDYKCVNPEPKEIDYSTFDILYTKDNISKIKEILLELFQQNSIYSLKELIEKINFYRPINIIQSLEELIINKNIILNKFGIPCYLQENNQVFYLDNDYPSITINNIPSIIMSYYTSNFIYNKNITLGELNKNIELNKKNLNIINEIDFDQINIDDIDKLQIHLKVAIIEKAILEKYNGNDNNKINEILNKYKYTIFYFNEPLKQIEEYLKSNKEVKLKRGRKPNNNVQRKIKKINNSVDIVLYKEDNNPIIVHSLFSQIENRTGYSSISNFMKANGNLRIFKNGKWDTIYVSNAEYIVYNNIIQQLISEYFKNFEKQDIYGFTLPSDNKFRIVDSINDDIQTDNRKKNRGRECSTRNRIDLADIAWKIELKAPEINNIPDVNIMIETLNNDKIFKKNYNNIDDWDYDKILFYYKWVISKNNKTTEEICSEIKERMQKINKIAI